MGNLDKWTKRLQQINKRIEDEDIEDEETLIEVLEDLVQEISADIDDDWEE